MEESSEYIFSLNDFKFTTEYTVQYVYRNNNRIQIDIDTQLIGFS